ncbi:MAG: T9SS type A sorting domain-containing protein [Ignavibacteria bacterium]
MKTFYLFIVAIMLSAVLFLQSAEAQLTGVKTIKAAGGDYSTITAAITDLNSSGVGAGGVTFNIEAGFTESITAPLIITATGTSSNMIIFQRDKSTSGDNPKITRTDEGTKATTGLGGDGDAIIQINGTDYITFNGVDVQSGDSKIEYGYYTYKPSGTDGCQNVIIKNCTITMLKSTTYNVVAGIHISNGPTALTASTNGGVTVTDFSGRNENIEVSNNIIQNVNQGIYIQGYNHASPYDFYDQNITIGKEGAGNTIQDFQWSGTSGSCYAIYSSFCNNFIASYNNINNTAGGGAASTCFFYAIYSSYTKAATITYSYNTLTFTTAGSRAGYAFGNNAGDATSTLNIHHNTIENCVHGSSGVFSALTNGVSNLTLNVYSNTVRNNTINLGSVSLFSLGSVDTANVYENNISDITVNYGTGTATAFTISGSGVINMYRNSISNFNATVAARVYPINITGGVDVKVYNNLIYGINSNYTSPKIDAIRGISISSKTASSNIGIYYNTIYLNALTGGADFWTTCVYDSAFTTSTMATLDMRNNILVNASVPSGTGIASAFRRGGTTLNNYSDLSNNNLFYAGTPGESNIIFYDGTTSYQTFADFKAAVGPTRESYSVSGYPGFTSSTNLIPDGTNANSWTVYNNGTHIAEITNDYAGNPRPLTVALGTPDIGAYEFGQPSVSPTPVSITPPVTGSNIVTVNGLSILDLNFSNLGGIANLDVINYPGVPPPGTSGKAGEKFMNGYFTVTQTGGAGYTYDITYTYSESQLGTVSAEDKVRLAKSDDNGVTWVPYLTEGTGPGQYELNTANNTIKVYGLTTFSAFTVTDSDNPLPVKLTSFTSSLKGRDVILTWETVSENNNSGFEVERSLSGDKQWIKAGYVAGKGNSTLNITYTFEDKKLNSGKYNYRLKQIDNNGNFEYHTLSNTVEVGLPTKFDLSQNYPNPFNPVTKVDFSLPFDSKVNIKLYDITGREVITLVNDVRTAGFYTEQFNVSNLSSGTYFYRITAKSSGGDYSMTKKMMLIR